MIKAIDIHKSFGENEVLKGVTTNFYEGKTNLIIGSSGAGKTVLLKILVGLFQPNQGKILFHDVDVTKLNKYELKEVRKQVGMLFQGSALFDSMTVEENIRFPLDMFSNKTLKEKRARVDEVLERVNLSGVNNKYPSETSGGMQKRIGIARSIVLKPKYLFCDEPNSGLDPKTSILIDELIKDITRENNMTTILNTHDMNSVMEIGEHIVFLSQGLLEWEGDKSQVLNSDNETLTNFIFASPFLQKLRDKAMNP